MASIQYYLYSAILILLPIGCLALGILQMLANKYGSLSVKDKVTNILTYTNYTLGFVCGCLGFSLHASAGMPLWCTTYGFPPCFTAIGASKAVLAGFFFRRAQMASGLTSKFKEALFKYIGPIYCCIYFISYAIFTSFAFAGRVSAASGDSVSYCVFLRWRVVVLVAVAIGDSFNSVLCLWLFLSPLYSALKTLKRHTMDVNGVQHRKTLKFIAVMKWNTALTAVATTSSVITCIIIPYAGHWMWLFCLGDPFVNATCIYFMMASNRKFMHNLCTCKCCSTADDTAIAQEIVK
eukprot:266432_1